LDWEENVPNQYDGPQILDGAIVVRVNNQIYMVPFDELHQYRNRGLESLASAQIDKFFNDHKIEAASVSTVTILNGDTVPPAKK
jgi:hypothetical protein